MTYKPGDTYVKVFKTQNDRGVLTAPSALPVVTVYRNGALVITSPTTFTVELLATAIYKVSGVIPAYSAGDAIDVYADATVDGEAGSAPIDSFVLDSKRNADLQDVSAATVNAQCDTAISDAALATASQVAALNNLSSAQAQSAATAALNAYDPPTRTEATADKAEIIAAIPLAATIATAVWHTLLTGISTADTIGKKLKDWVLGTDSKVLISANDQDLNATLHVDAKAISGSATAADNTETAMGKIGFNAANDVKATLDSETVVLTNPINIQAVSKVAADYSLELFSNVDYTEANAVVIPAENYQGYDFTGGTAELRIMDKDTYNDSSSDTPDVVIAIPADHLAVVNNGDGTYDITATVDIDKEDIDSLELSPPAEKYEHKYQLWGIASTGEYDLIVNSSLTLKKGMAPPAA